MSVCQANSLVPRLPIDMPFSTTLETMYISGLPSTNRRPVSYNRCDTVKQLVLNKRGPLYRLPTKTTFGGIRINSQRKLIEHVSSFWYSLFWNEGSSIQKCLVFAWIKGDLYFWISQVDSELIFLFLIDKVCHGTTWNERGVGFSSDKWYPSVKNVVSSWPIFDSKYNPIFFFERPTESVDECCLWYL
jgi:hypothetical protein